jgi:hypothetical protein
MSLKANALVSLQTAKAFIQPGGMTSTDDARVEEVINRVSDAVERHCGRRLVQVNYTGANILRIGGLGYGYHLRLDHTPIDTSAPVAVTVDGVAQTVWRSDADGDPINFDVIVRPGQYPLAPDRLYRAMGWAPTWGRPDNVTVDYKGGFLIGAIPKDLEEAALEIIKLVWTDQSKGIQDVTTVNLAGGSFTLFNSPFPRRALELLQPYCRLVLA